MSYDSNPFGGNTTESMQEETKNKLGDTFKFLLTVALFYGTTIAMQAFLISVLRNTELGMLLVILVSSLVGIILGFQALYTILSMKTVQPDQMGVLLLLGRPVLERGPGFVFTPWLIFKLVKISTLVVKEETPGTAEQIWRGDHGKLPKGMFLPMEVTYGMSNSPTKNDDPIHRRMTTEVRAVSRFQVNEGILFIRNIGSVEAANDQIRATIEAKIKEEFAKRTPAEVLNSMEEINDLLKKAINELVESWGIDIRNIQILDIDLGKTVNQSLRNVSISHLNAQSTVMAAEAEKVKRTKEGAGDAATIKAIGDADAEVVLAKLLAEEKGLKEMMTSLNLEGEYLLAAITAQKASSSGNNMIFGANGMADLLGLAQAIKSTTKP